MLIDCHTLKDGGPQFLHPHWDGRQKAKLCACLWSPPVHSAPSLLGPAQGAGKPQMTAAQPPRVARGSGNQGWLGLAVQAVAAAEV